jgi:ribosomal protein S18 acetylase RimI-like enzyme
MRLMTIEKTEWMFEEIYRITKASFTGVELPPRGILQEQFDKGFVFVRMDDLPKPHVAAFTIVTERWGGPYIWTFAVDPVHRLAGLGSSLLKEIDDYASRLPGRQISLTVHVDNVPAQMLYLKHGYKVRDVLPKWYINADGLLMKKEIL